MYEASFKRKVIMELLSGTITRSELSRKYCVSRKTLSYWLNQYEQQEQQLLTLSSMKQDQNNDSHKQGQSDAARIKELEEALRLANIKVTCLETLIDVAEEMLDVDIRKKPGTRASEE